MNEYLRLCEDADVSGTVVMKAAFADGLRDAAEMDGTASTVGRIEHEIRRLAWAIEHTDANTDYVHHLCWLQGLRRMMIARTPPAQAG